jgi:hypothetical protein
MSAAHPSRRSSQRIARFAAAASLVCVVGAAGTASAFAASPQRASEVALTASSSAESPNVSASPLAAADAAAWAPVDGEAMNYAVNGEVGAAGVGAAAEAIAAAGGRVLVAYPEIGVTIAQTTRAAFATEVAAASGIVSAGPTRTLAVTDGATPPAPMPLAETLPTSSDPDLPQEGDAWDVAGARTAAAHSVTTGSADVVVGIADSGIDDTHPDLVGRVDPARSVGCSVNGIANTDRAAWLPDSSPHGTHVAGTVGAARNDSGIVGVAPSTTLAAIKVGDAAGRIYPEYVICGIMWAAETGIDIVNHSYFVDPWLGWCPDEASQAAGLEATRRAFAYATSKDVLSVAASGNNGIDFDARKIDTSSPDESTPASRPVSGACTNIPAGLPGILGVGASELEASSGETRYATLSNYGADTLDIVAPGISIWSSTPPMNGALFAPFPGTSMASPHVAGAAALVKAKHPNATPAEITTILTDAARAGTCPSGVSDCPDLDKRRMGAGHLDIAASLGVVTPDSVPTIGITSRKMSTTEDFPVVATGFRPGEPVDIRLTQGAVVQDLTSATADARGEVHASVRPTATPGSEPVTLSAVGRTSASVASTPVLVTVGVAPPTIASPAAGAQLPVGVVTISGTATPGAAVAVSLTKPSWDPNVDGALPKPPAAAPGEPVPFDPSTGISNARTVADATGAWSVRFAVPANAYNVSARQRVDGVASPASAAIAFDAVTAVPTSTPTPTSTASPTPTPTPTASPTPTPTPTETPEPSPQPTAGTGGSLPGDADAAATGSPAPMGTPGAGASTSASGSSSNSNSNSNSNSSSTQGAGPATGVSDSALAASGAAGDTVLAVLTASGLLLTGIAACAGTRRARSRGRA